MNRDRISVADRFYRTEEKIVTGLDLVNSGPECQNYRIDCDHVQIPYHSRGDSFDSILAFLQALTDRR